MADGDCDRCGGVFLSEPVIVEKIDGRQLDLDTRGRRSAIACPVCSQPMLTLGLFEISIDRCREHGIWFDKTELDRVIERAGDDTWRLYGSSRPSYSGGGFAEVLDALLGRLRR